MTFLESALARGLTEFDQREIWEWAAQEGELPSAYAVSGRLDVSTCPMIKGPLAALRRPTVRRVVSMAGVQCLKTLIGELWLLWSIVNDPGPTQWLQPDNEDAKEHAKERFLPLLEKFPAVHAYYTANRFDRTTAFFRFLHMYLRLEGGAERGNRQRKSIKNQMRSEIWQSNKWRPGYLKEASGRMTQFVHNSKSYTESQPGWHVDYGIDDMHGAYLEGDQNVLTFACQGCGHRQPFFWDCRRADGTRAGIRWDTTERTRRPSGEWRWGELIQTIRLECVRCGHRHHDDPIVRRRLTDSQEFVAQNPDAAAATASFNWGQLAMPSLPWFETETGGVKNFLIAHGQARKGFEKPLQDFWMKVVALPYNPAVHAAVADLETIEISTLPLDAAVLEFKGIRFTRRMMGVDVQEDHFWVLVEAWSETGDSLTLHAEQLYSWDEVEARRERFHVEPENVMVDISHRRREVIRQCAARGRWVPTGQGREGWACWKALQGSDQPSFLWIPKKGRDKGKKIQLPYSFPAEVGDPCAGLHLDDPRRIEFRGKRCAIYRWSNPTIKDIAIARRDGKEGDAQNLVGGGAWNEEFNRQMHSQRKVPGKTSGWVWQKFRDDHLLDGKCMVIVRAFQLGLLVGGSGQVELDEG